MSAIYDRQFQDQDFTFKNLQCPQKSADISYEEFHTFILDLSINLSNKFMENRKNNTKVITYSSMQMLTFVCHCIK